MPGYVPTNNKLILQDAENGESVTGCGYRKKLGKDHDGLQDNPAIPESGYHCGKDQPPFS